MIRAQVGCYQSATINTCVNFKLMCSNEFHSMQLPDYSRESKVHGGLISTLN